MKQNIIGCLKGALETYNKYCAIFIVNKYFTWMVLLIYMMQNNWQYSKITGRWKLPIFITINVFVCSCRFFAKCCKISADKACLMFGNCSQFRLWKQEKAMFVGWFLQSSKFSDQNLLDIRELKYNELNDNRNYLRMGRNCGIWFCLIAKKKTHLWENQLRHIFLLRFCLP